MVALWDGGAIAKVPMVLPFWHSLLLFLDVSSSKDATEIAHFISEVVTCTVFYRLLFCSTDHIFPILGEEDEVLHFINVYFQRKSMWICIVKTSNERFCLVFNTLCVLVRWIERRGKEIFMASFSGKICSVRLLILVVPESLHHHPPPLVSI